MAAIGQGPMDRIDEQTRWQASYARRMRRPLALATCVLAVLVAGQARAADLLVPGALNVDPPTVISLGVQLVITGDDDGDAKVTLRYRPKGASAWRDGLPLHRVRASVVKGRTVPEQFAGSALELAPDTLYELELHVVDPDGVETSPPRPGPAPSRGIRRRRARSRSRTPPG